MTNQKFIYILIILLSLANLPLYAGLQSGTIISTGTITATTFVGNGSGLTGLLSSQITDLTTTYLSLSSATATYSQKVNPTFTGTVSASLGSASAPAYSFGSDSNTGIYSSGSDSVSIATAGTERMRIFSNGNMAFDDFTNMPAASNNSIYKVFHFASPTANGSTIISMASRGKHTSFFGDNSGTFTIGTESTSYPIIFKTNMAYSNSDTLSSGSEVMRINGNGNVGIGTTSPAYPLDINGTVRLSTGSSVYVGNDTGLAGGLRFHYPSAGGGYVDLNTQANSSLGLNIRIDNTTATTTIASFYNTKIDFNRPLNISQVNAIDSNGLKLYDDGGNGIVVQDGGNVRIATTTVSSYPLMVGGSILISNPSADTRIRVQGNNGVFESISNSYSSYFFTDTNSGDLKLYPGSAGGITIGRTTGNVSVSNGNIITNYGVSASTGVFTSTVTAYAISASSLTVNGNIVAKSIRTPLYTASLPNIYMANGSKQILAGIGSSSTVTLNNMAAGDKIMLIFQNGSSSSISTWSQTIKWMTATPPTLTANKTDIVSILFDGTYYYGLYTLNL